MSYIPSIYVYNNAMHEFSVLLFKKCSLSFMIFFDKDYNVSLAIQKNLPVRQTGVAFSLMKTHHGKINNISKDTYF